MCIHQSSLTACPNRTFHYHLTTHISPCQKPLPVLLTTIVLLTRSLREYCYGDLPQRAFLRNQPSTLSLHDADLYCTFPSCRRVMSFLRLRGGQRPFFFVAFLRCFRPGFSVNRFGRCCVLGSILSYAFFDTLFPSSPRPTTFPSPLTLARPSAGSSQSAVRHPPPRRSFLPEGQRTSGFKELALRGFNHVAIQSVPLKILSWVFSLFFRLVTGHHFLTV